MKPSDKKLERLVHLETLPENLQGGFLAISKQIEDLNDKLKALYGSVKAQNSKEVITYQKELNSLLGAISSLQEALVGKDMVVNIPLDNLASQILKVEQAIKAIKEVKIPEFPKFPTEFSLDELQINELLLAIQSLPQFPIDELRKMVDSLGKKIKAIKIEIPEQKIDYEFFYERFKRLEKAVNGITISVSGGGGIQDYLVNTNTHTGSREVRVYQENHICSSNTSSTPLGAGATFTGNWQDCLNYQEVNISIDTDQNSATDGLVIEWSADGTNIADTDKFSVYANAGTNYTPNPAFRYVRLKYTNGATPQTRFNLMTILRRGVTGGSFHRITDTLKDDSDGRLNLSVLKLRTAANNYVSGSATNNGNFKVSIEEFDDALETNPLPVKTPGFQIPNFDYVGVTYPNTTTEVFTYKTGGAGGTTVSTITVVYTDVSKEFVSSITKS